MEYRHTHILWWCYEREKKETLDVLDNHHDSSNDRQQTLVRKVRNDVNIDVRFTDLHIRNVVNRFDDNRTTTSRSGSCDSDPLILWRRENDDATTFI